MSVLDEIQTASFSSDNILIVGLREEFDASYTLLYGSDYIGEVLLLFVCLLFMMLCRYCFIRVGGRHG